MFLSSLPSLLQKQSISEKILNTLLLVAKQGNKLFYTSFLEKLPLILGKIKKLLVDNL